MKCPFCRIPAPTSDEIMKRFKKRVELDDAHAMYAMGVFYFEGSHGLTQDYTKTLEYNHRAGELGSSEGYTNAAVAYYNGEVRGRKG